MDFVTFRLLWNVWTPQMFGMDWILNGQFIWYLVAARFSRETFQSKQNKEMCYMDGSSSNSTTTELYINMYVEYTRALLWRSLSLYNSFVCFNFYFSFVLGSCTNCVCLVLCVFRVRQQTHNWETKRCKLACILIAVRFYTQCIAACTIHIIPYIFLFFCFFSLV